MKLAEKTDNLQISLSRVGEHPRRRP
jgi:hypothetical protein